MEAPDDRDVDLQQEAASIDALLAEIPGPITSVHEGRLVISKMVLENFKSYGGVKEIGPFHTSMSAVVGPNGSGKSNVIDALLFVFGKRATKLRLKKVSELIHKSRYVAHDCVSLRFLVPAVPLFLLHIMFSARIRRWSMRALLCTSSACWISQMAVVRCCPRLISSSAGKPSETTHPVTLWMERVVISLMLPSCCARMAWTWTTIASSSCRFVWCELACDCSWLPSISCVHCITVSRVLSFPCHVVVVGFEHVLCTAIQCHPHQVSLASCFPRKPPALCPLKAHFLDLKCQVMSVLRVG